MNWWTLFIISSKMIGRLVMARTIILTMATIAWVSLLCHRYLQQSASHMGEVLLLLSMQWISTIPSLETKSHKPCFAKRNLEYKKRKLHRQRKSGTDPPNTTHIYRLYHEITTKSTTSVTSTSKAPASDGSKRPRQIYAYSMTMRQSRRLNGQAYTMRPSFKKD